MNEQPNNLCDLLDLLCAILSGVVLFLSAIWVGESGHIYWAGAIVGFVGLTVSLRKYSVSPTIKRILAWFGFN